MITSFSQIGWKDPFPDEDNEDKNIPETVDVPVYPEWRYVKGFTPYVVYIPRKQVMFKLM